MSDNPIFNRAFSTPVGELQELTPWLRRITAPNPGPFTFRGTGTYIVGRGQVAVIDPGPAIKSHIDAIIRGLGDEQISHILVTHAHQDHSPGCRLLKRHTDAEVCAFESGLSHEAQGRSAEAGFDQLFVPDRILQDGDLISSDQWSIESMHTPGHTSDHLCFALPEQKALFTGDHVMGWSTSIVSPPDGHMGDYIRSLQALLDRDESVYWPTHGGPIENPQQHVQHLIDHRMQRETQILRAVENGRSTLDTMLKYVYTDIEPVLYPAAQRSLLAAIDFLIEKGELQIATSDGETIYRLP